MSDTVRLGDLCKAIVDCEHKTAPAAAAGMEFGYSIGTPNIRDGRILVDGAKKVNQETYKSWTSRAVPEKGDIILAREAPVGQAGYVDGSVPVCLGQRTVLLKSNPRAVSPRFLHYLLLSPEAQHAMLSKAEGSTVKHLNVVDIRNLPLRMPPPRASQDSIANLLGALDDKIAVNERIVETYESILRARFNLLGVDVDVADEPVAASELVQFNPRCSKVTVTEAVYVDMAALPVRSSRIVNWVRRPPKSGARFMNGDTLMARITPCLENGKTGFVDFLADCETATGSTEFIVLRAQPGVPPHLPYFLARSSRFRDNAIRQMVGSSGRQRVAAAELHDFPVRRPSRHALRQFGEEAHAAFAHMKVLDGESRTLAELRDTLLPKLMSGEIRVREAERRVGEAL